MVLTSSSSASICGGNHDERRKLLQRKASSSSDPTKQNKDDTYFPNREAFLFFMLLLLLGVFYHGIFFSKPLYDSYGTSAIADYPVLGAFYRGIFSLHESYGSWATVDDPESGIAACTGSPCFEPSNVHVPLTIPGFPSFLKYAHRGPISVSYDKRSLKLNGDSGLFLGGSMHPARATFQTWNFALDEAVENGLNLITIYVMWSDHQPVSGKAIDWTFPDWSSPLKAACHDTSYDDKSCSDWNLANAIRSAANRGLFVHLRVGPYDCAEYSYGGIPEWLLVEKPNMILRRPNREWLDSKFCHPSAVERGEVTF